MATRHLPSRCILAALLFLPIALPAGVRGQDRTDTVRAPLVTPTPPAEEVFGGVNGALREIGSLRARVADRTRVEAAEERVEAVEDRFARTVEETLLTVPVDQMGRGRLQELLLLLPRFALEVDRTSEEVTDALSELAQLRDSLRTYEASWSEFGERTDTADLSEELTLAVQSVLAVADSGRAEAATRSGELLTLEGRTLALGTRIAELAVEAEARERTLLVDLLEQNAGPIWTILGAGTGGALLRDLAAVPRTVGQGLKDLLEAYRGRVMVHGVVGLLILALVLAFSRSSALTESPELETARRIFGHPLAVSVILTLAFTQSLYPTAQAGVLALNTVLFLAAELVVLHAALPFVSPPLLWIGGSFLGLARFSYLLPFDTVGHRLAFLFSSVGSLVLVVIGSRILRRYAEGPWCRRLDRLLLAVGVLLGVAVLANLVGLVGLAVLLTRSMVRSFLAALGLLTLVVVLRALVEVALRVAPLNRLRSVRAERARITASVFRIINWTGFAAWIWATLVAFRVEEALVEAVVGILEFRVQLGEVSVAPATLVIFGLSVWLAVNVSRVTRFFLDQDVLPRLSLPRGVPGAISTSVHYLIVGLALAFGVTAMGLDLSSLAFIVGALGVGIGFGLQNIINNFISGLILLFERPIQVGDEVKIGELMGTMKRIGIRASIVRTYEGSEVIVPNGDLISQQVINYTLSDRLRRLELRVGVA